MTKIDKKVNISHIILCNKCIFIKNIGYFLWYLNNMNCVNLRIFLKIHMTLHNEKNKYLLIVNLYNKNPMSNPNIVKYLIFPEFRKMLNKNVYNDNNKK